MAHIIINNSGKLLINIGGSTKKLSQYSKDSGISEIELRNTAVSTIEI